MTTKAKKKAKKNIKVFQNIDDIGKFAADKFISIGKRVIKKDGRFAVALAGGSTPESLYKLLSTDEYINKIDWENVYFFIGDERDVSPMSEMSNFRMINEIMLSKLPIPKTNIFRWHTEIINALEVAESYNRTIVKFFNLTNDELPRFDLMFLGMGDDGHTASLFPFTDALQETKKFAVSNYVEKLDAKRLTLTFPAINNSANVFFLIAGEKKSGVLKEVLEGKENVEKFPSQGVQLNKGKLFWLVDKNAATELAI